MVEACTGVIREKFMDDVASRTHCERGGVRESHALEDVVLNPLLPLSGAMVICVAFPWRGLQLQLRWGKRMGPKKVVAKISRASGCPLHRMSQVLDRSKLPHIWLDLSLFQPATR